jgi:hypothetical protein
MDTRNDILNEMNLISPDVAVIGNANVYNVPVGYFSSFADEVLTLVKAEYLLQQNVHVPYKVPANYFDGLSNNILAKIRSENEVFAELEEVAPFLNTINKKNIYTTPVSYFDNLSANASDNINVAKPVPAKIFNIGSATRKWLTYAAAAVFAGIIGTGILLRADHSKESNEPVKSSYASMNVDENISNLSDTEIAKYLDTHSSENEIAVPASSDDDIDVQDFLNNSSDEEIQQYLNSTKMPGEKSGKGI